MEKFLTLAVGGAATGTIFSLVAVGLVLSYTATGIYNLAYGAIAFCAAFAFYELRAALGWPVAPALILTVFVLGPLVGLLLDFAVFRPLARATEAAKIMATVGLLIALPAIARFIDEVLINDFHRGLLKSDNLTTAVGSSIGPVPPKTWKPFANFQINSDQLVVLIVAVIVAVVLWFLMRRTSLGLRMRAVVDRHQLAQLRGVSPRTTSALAWVIGTTVCALAGVVGAPLLGSLIPDTFTLFVFIASAAAVVGGLRSIPLAFAGGLIIGISRNLVPGYLESVSRKIQGFGDAIPFLILFIGLIVMSRDRSRVAGSAADVVPPADYARDLSKWRRRMPWMIAVGLLILFLLWPHHNHFWLGLVTSALAFSLIFLSFTIVTGIGGMVSLAQAGFVTASGLSAGLVINKYGWPFLPALLLGIAVSVVIGIIIALPALRLGGLPLALATLALAFLGDSVLFQWNWLRHGTAGWVVQRPALGAFSLNDTRTMAFVLLALIGLIMLGINNMKRSPTGRAMLATRASEPAAATSGVSPVRTKLLVFALSAGVAGLGGVMLASFNKSVTNQSTPATVGLLWLSSVVLFGIRRPAGAFVAGLSFTLFPQLLNGGFRLPSFLPTWLGWHGTRDPFIPAILFGLGAIQLSRQPDGILTLTASQNYARRLKRKARRAAKAGQPAVLVGAPSGIAEVVHEEEEAISAQVARHEEEFAATVGRRGQHPAVAGDGEGRPEPRLVMESVRAGYDEVEVLHGVSFELRPGRILALLGANGAGKSTLCASIAGLVSSTAGQVLLDGKDISRKPAYERARAGVVLAPEGRGIFPGLTVQENLTLWLPSAADRQRAYERFPLLGARRRLAAGSLSGGEQQMLTLAPLLVHPPVVLVADEPSLGLAPLIVRELMGVFSRLRDEGVAILLVEEKARDVLNVADDVAFLELGHVGWSGPRAEVDDDRLAAAYLGMQA
jgi:ABC-type branched-subunit amino acid transport system ATPase component/branched-subunit amino acid ABC-type transport system permease component